MGITFRRFYKIHVLFLPLFGYENYFYQMKKILFLIFLSLSGFAQNVKNKYLNNETVTYRECLDYYSELEKKFNNSKLIEFGLTDVGIPLHVFMITNDGNFDVDLNRKNGKVMLLINNGIHAGEPCGVDACLSLSEDLLSKSELKSLLNNVVICIVPFYNIDGALNRGCCSRANQNGPKEHGFRANAKNLDLNRDFIKCDAQNTRSLIQIIQQLNPQVFVDTHISNGADYSYNMTLIASQHNKLHPLLGNFMTSKMIPELYRSMKLKNNEMCPYVDTKENTPDSGLIGFLETPRFATGFTALNNRLGFVTEAHMLKPYPVQVKATYDLLLSIISFTSVNTTEIISLKNKADEAIALSQNEFVLNWKLDTSKYDMIEFKGYEAAYKKSNISGLNRLYYNREKPFTKKIKYYNYYNASETIKKPKAYVIPQAWSNIIELLKLNRVVMQRLNSDTVMNVNCYYIENYKTSQKPYEGHYLHHSVSYKTNTMQVDFYKGDYLIFCDQISNRFLIETLEPKAVDSYFNWNFFDSFLQQKEWFSDYVYEETAEKIWNENPELRNELNKYVLENNLQNNHYEQLAWIFKNSPQHEKTAFRYPIFRIE